VVCGVDACGGLCGGCFTFQQDDGTTETAYGYNEAPASTASAVVCMVRVSLPHTAMRLTGFTAGWMYGLWNLQIPFDLVVAPADAFICQQGDENTWWIEACQAPESALTILASLLPARTYEPQPAAELGDHVMTATDVFIGARFPITEYPIFVCPMDEEGSGENSFMFPASLDDGESILNAAAMKAAEKDAGAIPFRFRFELTEESQPIGFAIEPPTGLPDTP